MAPINWKNSLRLIALKLLGGVLAVVFLGMSLIFIGYPVVSLVVNRGGDEGQIVSVSNCVGKARTGFRVGGIFTASVKIDKKTYGDVYCLYPAWPDQLEPTKGDYILVWPEKKPLLGVPETREAWGWFILGTLFIFGLVFLEFAFLSLTLH
jgi:hypothetical protein